MDTGTGEMIWDGSMGTGVNLRSTTGVNCRKKIRFGSNPVVSVVDCRDETL